MRSLRERYPRWGMEKLAVLLEAEALYLPVSRVGRVLGSLKRTWQLIEPMRVAPPSPSATPTLCAASALGSAHRRARGPRRT
jgi:hypothetical protein